MAVLLTTNSSLGPNNTVVTFYVNEVTPGVPMQRITVGRQAVGNPNWIRANQLTDEHLLMKRGLTVLAIPLSDLEAIALPYAPGLSYSPNITVQPVPASVVAGGGNSANFTVSANSETDLTYSWAVDNGAGWLTGISNTTNNGGGIYTVTENSTLTITPSSNSPNSYSVVCTLENASGNANTTEVTLTVT